MNQASALQLFPAADRVETESLDFVEELPSLLRLLVLPVANGADESSKRSNLEQRPLRQGFVFLGENSFDVSPDFNFAPGTGLVPKLKGRSRSDSDCPARPFDFPKRPSPP